METIYARQIIQHMARERSLTFEQILNEYQENQVNGKVSTFFPDENEACSVILGEI